MWSLDTKDSLRYEGKVADEAPDYGGLGAGDIVLMHDDHPGGVTELRDVLSCTAPYYRIG